jgi:arsenite methyltransferase
MRALTRTSVPAPDYALRVPSHVQLVLTAGVLGGLIGLGLLVASPMLPAVYGYVLIALGVLSAAVALALRVITSPSRRERARRQMLSAIAWRGTERVLDVGCGNGFLVIEAAKRLTTGTATGIDVWKAEAGEQSAEVAWRNAHLEGVADRVEIKEADARPVPFGDNTFDVIVSSLMLHHVGGSVDRHAVLQEMLRVLKPGGTLLLYDVLPMIADASSYLRANGLPRVTRSGGLMATLMATDRLSGG